jgi:ubiquinone/menaquinone biosynthesis C-methylase UbiE
MAEPEFVRATRASYDRVAADYAVWIRGELDARPLDRALLAAFAELVREAGGGPVADIGCGPGRITRHLAGLGLDAFGIDLSPQMVAQARQAHPDLRFEAGSMLGLSLPGQSLGGILAWYSIIHVPDRDLPTALAEFYRVLVPGGYLLAAFQVGDEVTHRTGAIGHEISLDFHRRQPAQVAGLLTAAGLAAVARTVREADDRPPFPERTPQGYVLARRPPGQEPAPPVR